ncbi:hypothetical protein B5X24_HaOG206071 [Helicoverpa armigera]|uniref:Uncharacterized protein n=1 Tax=Helicoverpa armigera TaxID=29058 RepID=A0A2W1BK60_HELAM|nr:hypothetical protein B5X24_HaOG206071 [Helicoverpa armigera]
MIIPTASYISLFIIPLLGCGLLSHREGLSVNHYPCSMYWLVKNEDCYWCQCQIEKTRGPVAKLARASYFLGKRDP